MSASVPLTFSIGITADTGSTLEAGAKLIAAFCNMNPELVRFIFKLSVGGGVTIAAIYCGSKYVFPSWMMSKNNEVHNTRLQKDVDLLKEEIKDVKVVKEELVQVHVQIEEIKASAMSLEHLILREVLKIRNQLDSQTLTNMETKRELCALKNQVSEWTDAPEMERSQLISQIQKYLDYLTSLEAGSGSSSGFDSSDGSFEAAPKQLED